MSGPGTVDVDAELPLGNPSSRRDQEVNNEEEFSAPKCIKKDMYKM